MTSNNEHYAREQAIAREYEKKMAARERAIKAKAESMLPPPDPNSYQLRNLITLFESKFTAAFSENRYEKPSEFFLAEMPWIFGQLVYDRFRDAFLHMVDWIRDYPYTIGWYRRTFRSEKYLHYVSQLGSILLELRNAHCIDADICDTLSGDLPEDARCYLKTRNTGRAGFSPAILAYELDRDNPKLEAIVTDIINGDSDFSTVSRELIQGIVMSRNPRMHQLLCRLLVAARLQEGLRQSICEEADCGTAEAFRAILSTILEHDLLRYSSVKRAVGTWVGLMNELTRDLDRISGKTVELICRCLQDPAFREVCIRSDDAMQIHIALWSACFENVQKGFGMLERVIREGTAHQVLCAGYFVSNLNNPILRHTAARRVLAEYRERYDILAVYLPSFIPYSINVSVQMRNGNKFPDFDQYFENEAEAAMFCDWLTEIHGTMKKKELTFAPCIFPWYTASLKRSDLMERAMILAAALHDAERIDRLCPHLADCDAGCRDSCFQILTMGRKTPVVRKTIIDCMHDKSLDTRQVAYLQVKGMTLTDEEYLKIEDMLRLRYDDLRRNAMALLLQRDDEGLRGSIARLLASAKAPMRTAGLDLITQLSKQGDRQALVDACMEFVRRIPKPTTQEQILIDALIPKQTGPAEPLFTEADRYEPIVAVDDYAKDCIRAFMALFPDSRLEEQILAGVPVIHTGEAEETTPCAAALRAKENLKSLSDFFVTHEKQTFTNWLQINGEIPLGSDLRLFSVYSSPAGRSIVPCMELWEQWRDENGITLTDLLGMLVTTNGQRLANAYLIRCGKYVADLYGPGFEYRIQYRYAGHIQKIVHDLVFETIGQTLIQQIASAVGIWIARCLPDEMFLGSRDDNPAPPIPKLPEHILSGNGNVVHLVIQNHSHAAPAGHFIAHPQINRFFYRLSLSPGSGLCHRIPIAVNVYERTFQSSKDYMEQQGLKLNNRVTLLLDQIYNTESHMLVQFPQRPEASTFLYACHEGLISERTLYYHLMAPGCLKPALELVTSVCAAQPEEVPQASARVLNMFAIRRRCENFIGKQTDDETRRQLVDLCRRTAGKLVPIVLDAELNRGDTPTEYSACVTGINFLSGTEVFVRILSAMGRDTLDRTIDSYWGTNDSKRGNLSYLLGCCTPAAGDTAEKLGMMLKNTDIREKRLIEAALYSPAWIDLIGAYLRLPGFKSACYYFMAHMNESFDDQKKAVIARYSPLSEDEFNQGAFDINWFSGAYSQLGEEKFNLIYDAAKYISDGSKHTRARKFADAALGRMTVEETEAAVKDKRNKDLLMAYALIPLNGEDDLIRRYLFLQQFLKESRQFGAQRSASEKKAVETALRNLATNAGFSDTMRLTLRMETRLVEDSRELFDDRQIGEWMFRLEIDGQGSAAVLCFKDGKALKSIPAKAKKDPYVVRLQEMKKQLTDQYRRTRRMFEQAMEDGTVFTLEEMRQLAENRVVAPMISRLVFRWEAQLGLFDGTALRDLSGNVLTDGAEAKLTVAHPFHLYTGGSWPAFQQYLFDHQIVQPFRQVFRELYVKTADELGSVRSLRYAGHQIQPKKAAACLKERRWVADVESGLQKVYYQENIVAAIYALADWFTPGDIEEPTLEYVAFCHRRTGEPLKIDEIPDVIFSEVMRDVDMAVSVAHAGGVDPETSHSTVEMRAAILGFTLPLLRLENVCIEGSHAFIDGKLANYAVHLGSGVVHQIGGAMLSVLPVHSQHRGRIFLPFVDDDPKTAEIISKVILFSEDKKLKDPTILSQIIR